MDDGNKNTISIFYTLDVMAAMQSKGVLEDVTVLVVTERSLTHISNALDNRHEFSQVNQGVPVKVPFDGREGMLWAQIAKQETGGFTIYFGHPSKADHYIELTTEVSDTNWGWKIVRFKTGPVRRNDSRH